MKRPRMDTDVLPDGCTTRDGCSWKASTAKPPNAPELTLGTMYSAIRDKPEKWETDSEFDGSVETILGMMDMVWKGHYRHGDESAPLEMSQEAAEMTVQTAVLLVSWFRSGRIRLRSHVT